MFKEINILGGGKIGVGLAIKSALKNRDIIFNLITRNKEKFLDHEISYIKNINIYDYSDKVNKNIPCFYCISANEQKIIEEQGSRNKNINRVLILKYNLKIAYDMVDYIKEINPKYLFVITNPVEIVSTFLNNKLSNIDVFGLGLELDSKRIKDILYMFFDLEIENDLFVLGNHSLFPVPILSNTLIFDKLKNISISNILKNLNKNKIYNYGNTKIDFYEEFYNYINLECLDIGINDVIPIERIYEIISYFMSLLVKSEFCNNKPPVDNPIDSLVKTISKLLSDKEKVINLSYFSNTGVYTGGLVKFNGIGKTDLLKLRSSNCENDMINKGDLKMCITFIDVLI